MLNVECYKLHDRWSLKFFRETLLNGHPGGFVFFWSELPEKRAQFFLGKCDLRRNYGMVVISFFFLCNYDTKITSGKTQLPWWRMAFCWQIQSWKCSYKEWVLFSKHLKKSIKIDHEYATRPLIKSYNCY